MAANRIPSVHGTLLGGLLCRERKTRFGGSLVKDARAQIFPQRWTMFEAVAGASARNPYILKAGMLVNKKVTVPGIFVLAYACLDYRRALQSWNVLPQIGAQMVERQFPHNPHPGIRIKLFSMPIEGDFESAALNI